MSDTVRERINCTRTEQYSVGTRDKGFVDYTSRKSAVEAYTSLGRADPTTTLRKTEVLTVTIVTEINEP